MSALANATKPDNEPILNAIVAGLLNEGRLAPGTIVDAGAFDGSWALWAAARWPRRTVRAVDPLESNVNAIAARAPPNLMALGAALGRKPSTLFLDSHAQARAKQSGYLLQAGARSSAWRHADSESADAESGSTDANRDGRRQAQRSALQVRVRTLDDLFSSDWRGERLALLHLDVESAERDVLRGGINTLRRDMPVLTVEVHVHLKPPQTSALIRFLAANRYEVFLIEEICGMRADCRNLLCIHRGARRTLFGSDALDMAVSSRAMVAVDATSIGAHAFPCCAQGDECCPTVWGCCAHSLVHRWLSKQVAAGGRDIRRFTRTRWYDQQRFVYRQHARLHALQQREMRRSANDSGLSYTQPGW